MMSKFKFIVLGMVLCFAQVYAAKSSKDDQQIDAVLDRLEKKILDFESQSLDFDGAKKRSKSQGATLFEDVREPASSYELNSKKSHKGASDLSENLADISRQMNVVSAEIEKSTADIERIRREMFQSSQMNQVVAISFDLQGIEKYTVRSIRAKIDDFTIISFEDSSRYWDNVEKIPVYRGPMVAGKHVLTFEIAYIPALQKGTAKTHLDQKKIAKSIDLNVMDSVDFQRFDVPINL